MQKFTRLILLVAIGAAMLTACVATTYKVGNAAYNNRDEAIAATRRENADAESGITAGVQPLVDKKLLVVTPTASAYSKLWEAMVMKQGKQYASPGTPARATDDFNADVVVINMKSVVASLKKANIYRETEVLDVDNTTPNIQPSATQDVLILNSWAVDGALPMNYFLSARFGKQVVAIDMGIALRSERRKSLINDVKAKALQ